MFLVCLRLFQGYGPPLHYIEFFTPFNWFALVCFINQNQVNEPFTFIIVLDLAINSVTLLILNLKTFQLGKSSPDQLGKSSPDQLGKSSPELEVKKERSIVDKFILNKERVILEYVEFRLKNKYREDLRFAVLKQHYLMVLECAILLFSNKLKSVDSMKVRNTNPFPIVDNKDYSFYQSLNFIYTDFRSLMKEQVTTIFFDEANPIESDYIKRIKEYPYFQNWKIIRSDISSMAIFESPA